jgi:hypothetical protein
VGEKSYNRITKQVYLLYIIADLYTTYFSFYTQPQKEKPLENLNPKIYRYYQEYYIYIYIDTVHITKKDLALSYSFCSMNKQLATRTKHPTSINQALTLGNIYRNLVTRRRLGRRGRALCYVSVNNHVTSKARPIHSTSSREIYGWALGYTYISCY